MSTIDPRTLGQHPLILKPADGGGRDFTVLCAGHLVGRIMRSDLTGGAESWLWTVTGPYLPEALRPSDGRAGSLEEAKAAFRAKFDGWSSWALEQGGPVLWHGSEGSP